jgi:hypothetical protein
VGSPRFLLANGLSEDTVCGQRLYIHPTCGLMARFEQEIKAWHGVTQGFYVDRSEAGYLLQTFSVSPDQMYLTMPYSLGLSGLHAIKDMAHMAQAGPLVHDEDSEGKVTPSTMQYNLGDGDRKRLLAGVRETARVFFAAGATEVYTGLVGGKPILKSSHIDAQVSDDVPARDMFLYASHPMSTCAMGDNPERSVVDPDGRVWGWDNLYVADASTLPTSLGVNPQVTTMAVGLTIGEAVAGSLG